MGTPGPSPEVTLEDALGVFTDLDRPSTPLTASEVAEELDCTRRTAHRKLEELSERDDLETKKTGAHSRIWWRPVSVRAAESDAETNGQSEREAFGEFVAAVEDYAIFTLDADGRVATWNEGARRIKGYEREEIVGEHLSRFYTDGDVEAGVPEGNLAAARDGGRIEDEGWRVRADGTEFWANVTITAIEDDEGELQGYTKIIRDMTDRREYEQRLQRERNRTQELLETAPIPIAVQDGDGNTVMANDRAQETLGLTESEFVHGPENEDDWTLYDADGDPVDPEEMPMARVLAAGEPVYDETVAIETPDGDRTWLSVNAAPFTGPDGDEARVVVAGEDVTGLKERERELETELSEVLGRVSDAFYAVDDEWRFTHVNDRAAEILGQSEETLIGRGIREVFPDAADVYWENLQRAMETQEPVSFEVHESGIDAWLEFNVYPSETGLSVYFRDVTDRKEYQRELAKYGTIVETMDDGIYVKDEDDRFTMVNDAYANMTGYDREELIGEHASLVVDEETVAASNARIDDGADAPMEAAIETADGETVPAEGTFSSLESGEEVGVVRDISEREERERQLRERERQLSTLMDNVPGMVYRCRNERDWPMEFVSEGCRDLTGYEPDELERGEVPYGSAVVHEEDRDVLWNDVQRGLDDDGTFLVTYRIVTADGDVRWVRERGRSVSNEHGDIGAIEGVIIDVTDRKRLESELDEVFGRVTDAFFALDRDWEFTYVNEKAHGVINPEGRDLEGKNVWEEFPDAIGRAFQEEYERAMYEQETVSFEEYYPEPLDAWYEVTAYPSETGLSVYFRDVTEQKVAQQQLEEERDMFAEGPAVVFRWGPEAADGWPVEYVSENVEDVLGYAPAELTAEGVYYTDLLVEEELDRIGEEVEAATERGDDRFTHEPYRVETGGGDVRWVKDTTKIVRDESGDVDHYLGYLVDITEQKEHERELERKERRYQAVFEDPNILVGLLEPDGTVRDINDTAMEYVDAELEELVGEQFSETPWWESDNDIQSDVREWVERAAAGEYVDFEADLTRPDGERYVLSGYFRPVTNDDGEVVSIIVSDRDITERKEYERQIKESERRYRTLVENFPDGAVGLFDEDLTYTAVGGELLELTDTARETRIGRSVSDIYPDELVESVEPNFQAALDGERNSFEEEFHGRHLHAHTLPVRNADDEVFAGMLVVQDITERREAQQELRESEAKFRMIAENLEEVVWMATPDAEEIVYLNPAFEEVWGIDRQQLYDESLSFLDRVHPEDREHVEEEFTSLPEEDFDEEFRIRRPDGEERWVNARGIQVTDAESEMTRIVGIGKDVTERVERERELERVLDLLEKTERIADVGGWEIDVDTEEVFWTDHVFDILGVDYDEEPPIDEALDMYHDEDQPIVEGAVEEAMTSGKSFDVEVRLDGAETDWIRLQGDPEVEDDDVVSFRGAAQDVTERVERERELEESERRYRTLAENFPNGAVGVYDRDLQYTVAEGDMLGGGLPPAEQLEGERMPDIFPEDTVEDLEPIFRAAVEDGETGRTTTEFGGKNWRVWAAPLRDADDDVFAGLSLAQDITERIERERRLEELVDRLEESNERLERFAYVASHDLQEPLRMISNYLQLLERRYRDELDEDAEEFIDFAVDGAERMRDMISDLLAYSRLDTEAEPFEPTDGNAVVDAVLDDLQLRIEETDAQITVEDLPTVEVDENQFEMVFQNLVSNAIKYGGDDPPRIEIGADRRDDEWVFSVADDGIGMEQAHVEDVFDVFNRLHTHDEYPGTGIGLAMCEKIVRHHGGDIWVESEPEEGSTFYFTVPVDHGGRQNR